MADLNIDGLIQGEGGMNGGRFLPPSNTNIIRVNKNKNNSNHNIYSSQQNLSKLNNSNNQSNFQRSRIYGSQQSLSTVSNNKNNNATVTNSKSAQHGFISSNISNSTQNTFSNSNSATTEDVWLNAWNSPASIPFVAAPAAAAIAAGTSINRPKPTTNTNTHNLGFNNVRNSHFNDPWTGDFVFFFFFFYF